MQVSLATLHHPNARRLFAGQLISQVCDKMMSVGLVWMFTERYPATMIPWFLGVSALPHLLLAWSAGRWTSTWGHVRTLWSSDLFRGVVFGILAVGWPAWSPGVQVAVLFAASFVANLAGAVFNPAIMSAPGALVAADQVQQLTAMVESCFSVGNVVGPLLSAVLYPWIGLPGLFLFNGLSYVWAAALEAGIQAPAAAAEDAPPALALTPRQVWAADPLVRAMLGGFLASNLCLTPIMVIMPLFVKACYHGHIGLLAGLEMAFGVGTVVGGALLSAVRLEARTGVRIVVGMLGVAAAYLAFSASVTPWVGDLCLATLGFFLATTNVLSMTVFQQRMAPQDVPTLMSLVNLISVAAVPLSMAVVALVVDHVGVRDLALWCAAGLTLATVAVVSRPDLRAL